MSKFLAFLSICFFGMAVQAAPSPKRIGAVEGWQIVRASDPKDPVCYMAGSPEGIKKNKASGAKNPYLMISRRKGSADVVSFMVPTSYNEDKPIVAELSKKQKFTLYSKGDTAWAADDKTDAQLLSAMREGEKVTLIFTAHKKKSSQKYVYSLKGLTKALKLMDRHCPTTIKKASPPAQSTVPKVTAPKKKAVKVKKKR